MEIKEIRMRALGFFLVLCAASWTSVHAQSNDADAVAPSLSEIETQQRAIRSEIGAGTGRYKEMPSVKRQLIVRNQDKVFELLEGKSSLDDLNPAQKTEVFNALQSINAAITNKADERVVCERRKPIGSQRVERICKSLAQIKADREAARTNMQASQGICNGACRLPER